MFNKSCITFEILNSNAFLGKSVSKRSRAGFETLLFLPLWVDYTPRIWVTLFFYQILFKEAFFINNNPYALPPLLTLIALKLLFNTYSLQNKITDYALVCTIIFKVDCLSRLSVSGFSVFAINPGLFHFIQENSQKIPGDLRIIFTIKRCKQISWHMATLGF